MKKKRIILWAAVNVITVALLAWSADDTLSQPKRGGVFRYCDLKSPGILDPAHVSQNQDIFLSSQMFNALVNLVPGSWDVYPDLAERWEVSADKMAYTFYLRKGVKFHNGREMTADDVVYSFQRAKDPKYANSYRQRNIKTVEAIDKYTVRVTLSEFDGIFLVRISGVEGGGIVPKEVAEKYGRSFAVTKESFCGTGPYILKEWNPGRNVILEANPDYFRGRPYIDRVEHRTITDRDGEVLEFEAGNLEKGALKAPYDKKFLTDPKWKPYVQSGLYPNLYYFAFDINKKPYDNVKLRKAFAYAFDRERAIKVAGGGLAIPAYSLNVPGFEGYDANTKYYPFNPDMAKQLLREAGYPNGVTLECKVSNYTPMKQYTEFYISQMADLGINLKVQFIDMGTHRSERQKGKYDFYGVPISMDLPDLASYLYENFHSDNFGPSGNWSMYKNEAVDREINLSMKEKDKEKRIAALRRAEKEIMEDCPWVLSHRTWRTEALQPWVHGLEGKMIGVTGRWPAINLGDHQIWIDAEKQRKKERF